MLSELFKASQQSTNLLSQMSCESALCGGVNVKEKKK